MISVSNSETFQPSGTLLASGIGNFLTAATGTLFSKQVLYRCDSADAGKLYEMYSTNGDSAFAGAFFTPEVEAPIIMMWSVIFAVRMTNLEYRRRILLQPFLERTPTPQIVGFRMTNIFIFLPARLAACYSSVFKIDSKKIFCLPESMDRDARTQPRGYIAFKGPSLITERIKAGLDHASDYYGWPSYWPGAWVHIIASPICSRRVTWQKSQIILRSLKIHIAVGILLAAGTVASAFPVSTECESGAVSSALRPPAPLMSQWGFVVNQPTAVWRRRDHWG